MTWHEVARPQIHGYDMSCLAFVSGANHRFVSGAEEKVIRVFDAPRTFVATLAAITGVAAEHEAESRPLGANVPPLGLSNKPVFGTFPTRCVLSPPARTLTRPPQLKEGEDRPAEASEGMKFREEAVAEPVVLAVPPFEEHLLQSTLWPETYKLYPFTHLTPTPTPATPHARTQHARRNENRP
jgi:elongator complex protein 2